MADFSEGFPIFLQSMPLSTSWIQREWQVSENVPARALILGAKVSLLEAGTAWLIGSNRGAASALRVFMENAVAWLYYKDHPLEYRNVERREDDLCLPKDTQKYMKEIDKKFDIAYKILSTSKSRDYDYYYSIISNFVHAHPGFVHFSIPIENLAISSPRDLGFISICKFSDEFISDNYSCYFRGSWSDFPAPVQENLRSRLSDENLRKFLDLTY
ncbi:hypothetical protein [Roseomonas sp. USHLN139]|uniref:hypothetical protein n=1 Tax=Roseomonas sp. USHLN139 TaxID=3081298 RepID=UPI003B01F745